MSNYFFYYYLIFNYTIQPSLAGWRKKLCCYTDRLQLILHKLTLGVVNVNKKKKPVVSKIRFQNLINTQSFFM